MKGKRTKAAEIPKDVKIKVWRRDTFCCIFCGVPGLPEAHIIPRSHGGLGVEENIITVCRPCHEAMDNSDKRNMYMRVAIDYISQYYPDWSKEKVIYRKGG